MWISQGCLHKIDTNDIILINPWKRVEYILQHHQTLLRYIINFRLCGLIHILFMCILINSSQINRFRNLEVLAKSLKSNILFRFFQFLIFLFSVVIDYTCNNLSITDIFLNWLNPDYCFIEYLYTITIDIDIFDVLLTFDDFVIIEIKSFKKFFKSFFAFIEIGYYW